MDFGFGLLFHRFKTIFDRIKTVYCCDRNQQMQSKYSCSQSQGGAKSCSLTYKIPMWAYARQNVKHDSRKKYMVDGNDVIQLWKLFRGGQIGVDERSKNLDFDCIMKAIFIERNNTGKSLGAYGKCWIRNRNQKRNQWIKVEMCVTDNSCQIKTFHLDIRTSHTHVNDATWDQIRITCTSTRAPSNENGWYEEPLKEKVGTRAIMFPFFSELSLNWRPSAPDLSLNHGNSVSWLFEFQWLLFLHLDANESLVAHTDLLVSLVQSRFNSLNDILVMPTTKCITTVVFSPASFSFIS